MKSKSINGLCILCALLLASCMSWNEDADPVDGEQIYTPSYTSDEDDFDVTESTSPDGHKGIEVEHKHFAFTDYMALYSPHGNLEMVVAGASEACAVYGWKITYDNDGYVTEVCEVIPTFYDSDDSFTFKPNYSLAENLIRMKKVRSHSGKKIVINRNEDGKVMKVGNLEVPYGYEAHYFISEWGPFWGSDVSGGDLCFFTIMESRDTQGSYVNYLYFEDKLIAELAYWNGVFIKWRTYNRDGVMVNQSNDRNVDIMYETYEDFNEEPIWYIDE